MPVKASYGGTTYQFPDGTTDDQIYQYLNTQVTPTQTSEQTNAYLQPQGGQQQPQDQGWGLGEGGVSGVGTAAKSGLIAGLGHMAAAFHDDNSVYSSPFEDPNTSRYASQTAAGYKQQAEQAESKLGTTGKLLAGAAEYAPAMAAGIVNPVLGAGVAGAESTGDILGSQYEERGDYNRGMAVAGGAVTGVAQLATGGLAGRLAPEGAGALRKAAVGLGEAGAQGMGFQAGTNVGTGHDITEGLPEAAVTGMVAHGVIGGARRSMAGLSKSLGLKVNDTGKQALADVKQVENMGNAPSQGLVDNTTEYHNVMGDFYERAKTGDVDSADFQGAADVATNHGGDAALTDAYVDAANAGVPITKAAFDFNYTDDLKGQGEVRHAAEELGSSKTEAQSTLEANMKARPSYGKSGEEAKAAGNTWQTHAAKVQELGKKHLQNMLGAFDTNVNYVDSQINRGRLEGWDKDTMRKYSELGKSLRELYKIGDNYAAQNKRDFADSAEYESSRAMELAHDLGESSNLVNTRGEKGQFNPAHDIRKIDTTERMFRSEYPSFHAGNPRSTVEKFAPKSKELTATDLGLGVATKGLYPVARKLVGGAYEHVKARKAQKALAGGIEETRTAAQELARTPKAAPTTEQRFDTSLGNGDAYSASKASEEALKASGIDVPESPVETPSEQVAQAAPEAQTVEQMANVEAPAEQAVEAPKRSSVNSTELVGRRPEAPVEAPTETPVEPEPTPTPAPLKPSSELVKDPRVTSLVADNTGLTVDTIEQVGEGKALDEHATQDLEKNDITVPEVEEKIKAAGRHSQELVGQRPTETAAPSFMEESAPNVPSKTARPSSELAGKPKAPENVPEEAPAPEAQPAEPTPEEAPEAAPEPTEAPKPKSQDLVGVEKARQAKAIEEAEAKPRTPENRRLVAKKRAESNMYDKMQDRFKKGNTDEEIHQAIQDLGGITELVNKRGDNVSDLAQDISAKLAENKRIRAEEERARKIEESKTKGEVGRKIGSEVSEEVKQERYTKAVDTFRKQQKAAGVSTEHIERAIEEATDSGVLDTTTARNAVRRLIREERGQSLSGGRERAVESSSDTEQDPIGKFERVQRAKGMDEDLIQESINEGLQTGEFEPDVAKAHLDTQVKLAKEANKPPKAEKPTISDSDKALRWNRIQEAKRLNPEDIAKAEKEGWEDGKFDPAVANAALGHHTKVSKAAEKEALKPKSLTMKDTQVEMARFLTDSKISRDKHPDIVKMVENATREIKGRENPALSVSQTRALMQRVHNMLDNKMKSAEIEAEKERKANEAAQKSAAKAEAKDRMKERAEKAERAVDELKAQLKLASDKIDEFKSDTKARASEMERVSKLDDVLAKLSEMEGKLDTKQAVKDDIETAEKVIGKKLEGKSIEEVDAALEHFAAQAEGDQEITTTIAASRIAAKKAPEGDYKDYFNTLADTLQKAEEMKAEYPDKPEMWLAREDFDTLKKHRFAQEEGSYAGSLGVNLINKVFGRHKEVVQNVTNLKNRDQIAALMEKKASGQEAREEKAKSFKSATKRLREKATAKRKGALFVG